MEAGRLVLHDRRPGSRSSRARIYFGLNRSAAHVVYTATMEGKWRRLGMFHSWMSKTESGDRRLDVTELMLLAELYGKASEYFLQKE
jgi:hypothetical protein